MSPTSQRLLFTGPFHADHHARVLDALGAPVDEGARDILCLHIVACTPGRRRARRPPRPLRRDLRADSKADALASTRALSTRSRERTRRCGRHRRRSAHRAELRTATPTGSATLEVREWLRAHW